ncbi:MAG TPA: hypothetical protein VHL53_00960 [Acidimicrobiia bacterium]|nr:hypothetical protein [Acidimicrobiia bacterium]
MFDPSAPDGSAAGRARALWAVEGRDPAGDHPEQLVTELAAELAAALRAVRGYVPHQVWWEEGPAQALLAYQALREGLAT